MDRKQFGAALEEIDEKYIMEAEKMSTAGTKSVLVSIAAVAAVICAAVMAMVVPSVVSKKGADPMFQLSEASYGVTVEVVEHPEQQQMPMLKLLELSEDELFSRWPTSIVRGTVTDIQNVLLTAGEVAVVKAIVTVHPEKVLRGDVSGDLKILVSCPIDGTFQMEDTETVSAIRVGMEGIFMVQPYGNDELWDLGDAALRWKDIADYNFPDGRRYAFLATENGLLYAEWAYPSLAGAATLDQVEAFIGTKIGQ